MDLTGIGYLKEEAGTTVILRDGPPGTGHVGKLVPELLIEGMASGIGALRYIG
jgi:proteasome assembly chaperone (PAC2) family protein